MLNTTNNKNTHIENPKPSKKWSIPSSPECRVSFRELNGLKLLPKLHPLSHISYNINYGKKCFFNIE
jgi:hypothetical protein